MADEKFLLVSLKEDESKTLAQVLSNKTSRKILDMLAEKNYTETKLAKELNLPLSTVHYNMQALMKARLVQAEEFHYSEKGKEVLHYSLASKYVIIAPKDAPTNLKERLRRILPAGLVAVAAAGLLHFFTGFNKMANVLTHQSESLVQRDADVLPMAIDAAEEAAPFAKTVGATADNATVPVIEPAVENTIQHLTQPILPGETSLALWFLFGAVFTIIVVVVVEWILSRKK